MSKSKSIQVVILSSFSLPCNIASSEDVQNQWARHHRHKILILRQFLSQNLGGCNQVYLDLELKDNPNWHINLIGPESTVIIILSRGLLEFYQTPDRRPITDNDRHTSIVENIIKGLDANHNCTKKYFFVIFEEELLSLIPVMWQGSICHVRSGTDHKKVMTIIKDEPHSQKTFSTSFLPLSMMYNDDQAKFINYWKAIYREDKSHTKLSMYYIDQKLIHKQVTDDSPDNLSNTCGSDELMTNQLYYGEANDWLHKMIVIQGLSGCGKSALAQILCHRWGKGDSLTMFRAVVYIEINENNIQKPMIELMRFVPHESAAKKEIILNGLSATPDVLFILDVENYPWRKCEKFDSTEIGQLLRHQRTENLLVLTNQLSSEKDKRVITDADIIYELQCFDPDQVKHFFWKRSCPIDHMKCSEIFQELCKLPLYAVMIPRNDEVVEHTNLTAFCKGIVVQTLAKNFSKVTSDSLELFLEENETFKNICNLAWDLINDQTNMIPITDVKAKNINKQEDGLGFLDFITKPNDKKIYTTFLVFRLKTIQHFLAALHFVYTVCTPDIGRDFLLILMADHSIHNVWRFVTGLLTDNKKINSILKSLGFNHAPPKLLYIQAISESEMKFDEMDKELKVIISTWINSFNWEKISLYPSDCLAIIKTFNYLREKEKQKILDEVKELNFAHCNLDNEGMFHLIECLSKLKNVKLINMGGNPNFLNPLSRYGCVGYLKEILKNNSPILKRLYLGSSGLNFTGLRILKPTFLKLTDLTELDLSRNSHLDSKGWSLFADILKDLKNKELSKLFLADNNIDPISFIRILEQLTNYPRLKFLNLSGNHITSNIMETLIEVLMNICIRRLFLSNCRIKNSVLEILLKFISENEEKAGSLVSLGLSWNEFNDEIMKEMMESLKVTKKLQTLVLNHNNIGSDRSMQILSDSLKDMPALGGLYLSQCGIQEDGAIILCSNSHNVSVDLRKNNINKDSEKLKPFVHTMV